MKFLIYCLKDPITQKIRYIGCTKTSLNQRLSHHIYTAKNRYKTHCAKWINNLLRQGLKPIIELVEDTDENNWEEREKYYIREYKKSCALTNIDIGGKGIIWLRPNSSLSKNKPLYQCDDNYNVIKLWNSKKEASEVLNISLMSIEKCTQQMCNSNPTAGGYKWVNKELYDNNTYIKKNKLHKSLRKDVKNVVETDSYGNINILSTIKDCALYLKIPDYVLRKKLKKGIFEFNGKQYQINKKI